MYTNVIYRITNCGKVNVGGSGGNLCEFIVVKQDNYVKLQSKKFPTKFVGVKPNQQSFVGEGGKNCLFQFIKTTHDGNNKYIPSNADPVNIKNIRGNNNNNNNNIDADIRYNAIKAEMNSLKLILNEQQKQIIQLQNMLLKKNNNNNNNRYIGSDGSDGYINIQQ